MRAQVSAGGLAVPSTNRLTEPVAASTSTTAHPAIQEARSYFGRGARILAPLDALAADSASLIGATIGNVETTGWTYPIRRYIHIGPQGGDVPIRLGIFAGIHGDEPAPSFAVRRFIDLLESHPDAARGFCLFLYPICNPTGFDDGTRHSRRGRDLNREFWRGSREPEVIALERELETQEFDGIIALHSDDTSEGLYGFASGATLTEALLRPALEEASTVLPLNHGPRIDGFPAYGSVIRDGYEGILSAPPTRRRRPFEIILETPQAAPAFAQEVSLMIALDVILREYRKLTAYAPNL